MSKLPKPDFSSPTSRERQTVLKSGERRLIFSVHQFFQNEKESGKSSFRIDAVTSKTAAATGVSERDVRNIVMQAPDSSTAGKRRDRSSDGNKKYSKVDDFDRGAIRSLVDSFFL